MASITKKPEAEQSSSVETAASTATAVSSTSSASVKQPVFKPIKFGLSSRVSIPLIVTLKKDSMMLSPNSKTPKQFVESDIVAVEGLPLKAAISKGMVTIFR